ncbi:MAG: hypothetical protein ABFD92_16435 [Planctomycetaceae bacterium]|nr:hypothetical protein [Planctomycetaceae bacterium]
MDKSDEDNLPQGWQGLLDYAHDPEGWVTLDTGGVLSKLYKESNGHDVAVLLDSLVNEARIAWHKTTVLRRDDNPDPRDEETGLDFQLSMQRLWVQVFTAVREAEQWLYRALGPGNDNELLDCVGDALRNIALCLDTMTSPDDDVPAKERLFPDTLKALHGAARDFERLYARETQSAGAGKVPLLPPPLPKPTTAIPDPSPIQDLHAYHEAERARREQAEHIAWWTNFYRKQDDEGRKVELLRLGITASAPASPTPEEIHLEEIDLDILKALAKRGHALKCIDLATDVRADEDRVSARLKYLDGKGLVSWPIVGKGKRTRKGASITDAGRAELNRLNPA